MAINGSARNLTDMTAARDDFSWVPRYPAPVTIAAVPEHLRDNLLILAALLMSPAHEAAMEALARSDEADDASTIETLLAEARR